MKPQIKTEPKEPELVEKVTSSKKDKMGRWSHAECYLFQSLLQRFGKNWKRIQEHMKNRSLGQIRSHAQKYFEKVGPKRVEEFERRAKILQAYEILEKEKRLREQTPAQNVSHQKKEKPESKQEQESPITTEDNLAENNFSKQLESTHLKREQNGRTEALKFESQQNPAETMYSLWNSYNALNGGYLVQILNRNPELFNRFQGIQPYLDHSAFRAFLFHRQ